MKKIALTQVTSTDDVKQNLKTALSYICEAAKQEADLIAFPENVLYMGSSSRYRELASPIPGKVTDIFQKEAVEHNIAILLGSIPELNAEDPGRFFNTSIIINKRGEIIAKYRKIHLADVDLPGAYLQESKHFLRGSEITVRDHDIGKIGLAICYDLRFPNLFQQLAAQGAEIIFLPAAFTLRTGKDHWLPLLRARAIENQVYLIAPAQFGYHSKSRISYGSSVMIDPWGSIICRAPEKPGLVYGEIDLNYLNQIRLKMPVQQHKVRGIDY